MIAKSRSIWEGFCELRVGGSFGGQCSRRIGVQANYLSARRRSGNNAPNSSPPRERATPPKWYAYRWKTTNGSSSAGIAPRWTVGQVVAWFRQHGEKAPILKSAVPETRALHVAPGLSAAKTLREALLLAGRDEEVAAFPDDFSCGPIASDDPAARSHWWAELFEGMGNEAALRSFWRRIDEAGERLVVWYSRHAASERACALAVAERLGERPYYCIDATNRQLAFPVRGCTSLPAVSAVNARNLAAWLGGESLVGVEEHSRSRTSGAACARRMRRFGSSRLRAWSLRRSTISIRCC